MPFLPPNACRVFLAALLPLSTLAEEKKEQKPVPPEVKLAIPFALQIGATNTFVVRGINLTNAAAVKFAGRGEAIHAEIKSKGKADPPKPLEAKEAGDTQVETSAVLPKDLPPGKMEFTIESPEGSAGGSVLLLAPDHFVREVEPNGGFKSAQKLALPATVQGSIKEPMDVDVFEIVVTKPANLTVRIVAQAFGSFLDSIVAVYDEHAHLVAECDDASKEDRDSLLTTKLPAAGHYFITVIDAHDSGGVAHPYCLQVEAE